jgi:hypothetical protein
MLKKRFTELAVAVAMTISAAAAQAAPVVNGFANGGFETAGTTTPAAGWIGPDAGYTRVSTESHSGSWSARLDSPQLFAAKVIQNSVDDGGQPPLTAGDNPLFSFWAKGFVGTTGDFQWALRYLDSVGNILSDSGLQTGQQISATQWTEFTYDLGVVPVGATAAFVEIVQAMGPIDGVNLLKGEIFVDDVFLGVTAVPVPAAVWLFGSGLVGLVGVARRKKAA